MKKIISLLLVMITLVQVIIPVSATHVQGFSARYVNAEQATVTISISASGVATVRITCSGNSDVSSISTTTYIERKSGTSWQRVNIGTTTNTWTYNTTQSRVAKSYTAQLSSTGQYRTVVVFVVKGSTSETITKYASGSY